MDTQKLIKLSLIFDLTMYEIKRTELEVTDIPPIDAKDCDDSWWIIKDGHYTDMGIPKWLYADDMIRHYNPVQHYEALCSPDKEKEVLERMDGIIDAYVQKTISELNHLADELQKRYDTGYRIKSAVLSQV